MTSTENFTNTLQTLCEGRSITADQATDALREILSGKVSKVRTAGLLVGMHVGGATTAELEGIARAIREFPSTSLEEHIAPVLKELGIDTIFDLIEL